MDFRCQVHVHTVCCQWYMRFLTPGMCASYVLLRHAGQAAAHGDPELHWAVRGHIFAAMFAGRHNQQVASTHIEACLGQLAQS